MRKTMIAAIIAALATIGAAAPADAAQGGKRVVIKKQRICYTLNDVRRCHMATVHVVRVRGL